MSKTLTARKFTVGLYLGQDPTHEVVAVITITKKPREGLIISLKPKQIKYARHRAIRGVLQENNLKLLGLTRVYHPCTGVPLIGCYYNYV